MKETNELCNCIDDYADRFEGLTIDYRRHHPNWPKAWKLRRVANKNERAEFRVTEYFDTWDEVEKYIRAARGSR
jgi:hypothetical protein